MSQPPAVGSLTPKEYASLEPHDFGSRNKFRRYCRANGLPEDVAGWGMLFCDDENGRRVTVMTSDMDYWRMVRDLAIADGAGNLDIPPGKFPWRRDGWPDEWIKE